MSEVDTHAIYANTAWGRLGAQRSDDLVSVWFADGGMLGDYRLDRFEGGRLTPASLRKLFAHRGV